jgi:hypothetical protein
MAGKNKIFGRVLIGISIITLLLILIYFYEGRLTYSWIETPCTIKSSEITWKGGNPKKNISSNPYSYIVYVYKVNNIEYSSNCIYYAAFPFNLYDSQGDYAYDYRKGSQKKCYINPNNPQQAVLIKGTNTFTDVGIFFTAGIVFLVCLIWGLCILFPSFKEELRELTFGKGL